MWAGGFHNRVLLALRSGLLNEMTWALNTLVKVSAKDALQKVNQIPPLQDAVVELLNEQLQGLWSLVSSQDGLRRLSALKLGSLASRDEVAERREIILGALHSLLNFSWAEANADELSRDPTVVTAIDLALKLGKLDRDIFWEIHRYALDLLDNVANRVAVDPRNDALVSSLCQSLMEPDRHEVASALRSLLRLCHRDANSKEVLPIMNADDIVERLVSFLLLRTQDEELAYYAVEMLQRIAHGTHGGAKRIYDIGGPIVLRELVQMLRNEARHLPDPLESSSSFVPPHQFAERLKPIGQNALPSQPEGTANSGATNADSSRASLAPPVEDVTGTTTKHWCVGHSLFSP